MTNVCPTCHRPFHSTRSSDPSTSRDAGDAVRGREGELRAIRRGSHRHLLLCAYAASTDVVPMTDAEAASVAGLPQRSCWWKRCSELRQAGYISPDGLRRDSTTGSVVRACSITEAGMAELGRLAGVS